MSRLQFDRRRADRFAELLEHAENGRRPHRRDDLDAELVPMADFARSMVAVSGPEPSDDLRMGLRAMLLAKIEREGIGATAEARSALTGKTQVIRKVPTRGGGRARAAIFVGIMGGVLASGVSLASTDSVPGDALYSVKRTSEQAQLALAGSDSSRGRLHLEFAKSRMVETRQMSAGSAGGTLAAMDEETIAGVRLLFTSAHRNGDTTALDAVMAFVSQQRTELTQLRADLPGADAPLRASLDLLGDIETRANHLRAAILGGCEVMRTDRLGPEPAC
jgi:Domain of unknown function (DUF5667)